MKSMNMDIWIVGTSNQLFVRDSYTEKYFSKNKVVTGKTPFFVKSFVLPILFISTLLSDRAVLYGNVAFSILLLLTKKQYSSFLKKVLVFQKI